MPFVNPPPQGRHEDLEWAWDSVPHSDHLVSGDALFLEVDRDDGGVLFLLIDVMGHGEDAAFVIDHLFRRFFLWDDSTQNQQPGDLLMALTSLIAPYYAGDGGPIAFERGRDAARERYTTALAALFDPALRALHLAVAGFPPPYALDGQGSEGKALLAGGSLLGIEGMPTNFDTLSVVLGFDDRIVAMSDGILEASPKGPPGRPRSPDFKTSQLQQTLASLPNSATPAEQVARLFREVKGYVGPGWPADDSTAVLWRLRPRNAGVPADPAGKN